MERSIVIVCPDTNIRLWINRPGEAAMGGGKSAILKLADAWAGLGHRVTIAGACVEPGDCGSLSVREIEAASGSYDVAVFVTGSLGHFEVAGVDKIEARANIFWINGPARVNPPGRRISFYIAPARFLAHRAINEWGFPPDKVVMIPGEAVCSRKTVSLSRNPFAFIYASHPDKGLDRVINLLSRLQPEYPEITLDIYGGPSLYRDGAADTAPEANPDWIRWRGGVPQAAIEERMGQYGAMLYLVHYADGFSLATAEAMASGVVVIATGHGSNAEFIRHGWNGFLVASNGGEPDAGQAEAILRRYLEDPGQFRSLRIRAASSVQTWDEQALQWAEVWESVLNPAGT